MKNIMTTSILALSLSLSLSLSSVVKAQSVHVNNTTSCDYFIGLVGCSEACSTPVDADANTNLSHNLSMFSLSTISDIYKICIKSQTTGQTETIDIYDCGGYQINSPVYLCIPGLDCNNNTLNVDWWWSGGDFYIELRI